MEAVAKMSLCPAPGGGVGQGGVRGSSCEAQLAHWPRHPSFSPLTG